MKINVTVQEIKNLLKRSTIVTYMDAEYEVKEDTLSVWQDGRCTKEYVYDKFAEAIVNFLSNKSQRC